MAIFTVEQADSRIQALAQCSRTATGTDAQLLYARVRDLMRTGLPLCLDPRPTRLELECNIARLSAAIRAQVRMAMRRDWAYDMIRHRQLLDLLRGERALLTVREQARAA